MVVPDGKRPNRIASRTGHHCRYTTIFKEVLIICPNRHAISDMCRSVRLFGYSGSDAPCVSCFDPELRALEMGGYMICTHERINAKFFPNAIVTSSSRQRITPFPLPACKPFFSRRLCQLLPPTVPHGQGIPHGTRRSLRMV